jgi:hypothetical protein
MSKHKTQLAVASAEQNESLLQMRYYQAIWEDIKKKEIVRITAPKPLHRRIIKAVIKEKWLDYAYKLESDNCNVILTHSISNSIITFKITKHLNLKNITEHML